MSKRILLFVISVVLILSACSVVALAEKEVNYVKLDNALKDTEGWTCTGDDIVFKDGGLTQTAPSDSFHMFGYKNAKFQNEILQFDAILDFEGVAKWQGFMIRSQNTENPPWLSNSNYLVVFTEEYIELQRFHFGNRFLSIKPNPCKAGERVSIEFGAINIDEGVHLVLNVNGETVFSEVELKSEKILTDEGHFVVYNMGSMSLLPYTGKGGPVAPSVNMTSIETNGIVGDPVNISYNYADLAGGTEGESEYTWYRTFVNVDHYGVSQVTPSDFREKYMEKIEGATDRTYIITEEDVGCYLRCGIRAKSKETGLLGKEILTNSVKIDTVQNVLGNGIFFEKGNPYAVVNGNQKKLDNVSNIVPVEINKKLYVPVRFIAENLGYAVEWDATQGKCIISDGQKNSDIYITEDVVMNYDRILIPIDRVFDLFGIKSSFEPLYEIGIINDFTAGLDPIDYKVLIRSIKEATTEK